MKITLSAAMRARDASRPHAEHEAAARDADQAGQAPATPAGQQRPAAGGRTPPGGSEPKGSEPKGSEPRGSEPGGQRAGRPQQPGGRRGGQRSGRGRGRSRRRQG